MFTYREFNSLTDFTEVLNDILKELDTEYNCFLRLAQKDERAKLIIYENSNGLITSFAFPDCPDIEEYSNLFGRDKIIAVIDADIQITHYRIKKAEL